MQTNFQDTGSRYRPLTVSVYMGSDFPTRTLTKHMRSPYCLLDNLQLKSRLCSSNDSLNMAGIRTKPFLSSQLSHVESTYYKSYNTLYFMGLFLAKKVLQ